MAQAHIEAEAYRMATFGVATKIAEGVSLGAESSLNKLFWSEMDVRTHETALDLLGEDALLEGPWTKGFQFALAGPIYAGGPLLSRAELPNAPSQLSPQQVQARMNFFGVHLLKPLWKHASRRGLKDSKHLHKLQHPAVTTRNYIGDG